MRFEDFTDNELDAMESAFCSEGLKSLVVEVREERRNREYREYLENKEAVEKKEVSK